MLTKLLKIETRKNFHYTAFWLLSILYFLVMGMVLYGVNSFTLQTHSGSNASGGIQFSSLGIFNFPDIWQWIIYLARFFFLIPATLMILNICNEFEYRTLRQNLIDGLTRSEFLFSKFITAFMITLVSTVFIFALILLLGYTFSPDTHPAIVWKHAEFIGAYFLQLLTYLLIVATMALIIRKAALTIGLLLLYSLVLEPILAYKLSDIGSLLPFEAIRNLIRSPFYKIAGESLQQSLVTRNLAIVLVYFLVFPLLSYLLLRRKEV